MPEHAGQARAEGIEQFLLGTSGPPAPDVLRRSGLAGWAYSVAQAPALRHQLRPDFLSMLARHYRMKRELVPLITAWRDAGVDVLLFKGFWLSERVYAVPGTRFHGDVDILLRDEHVALARAVSHRLGWIDQSGMLADRPHLHWVFNLERAHGHTRIDAHRFPIHSRWWWQRVQRRITAAVWAQSQTRAWEGTDVREPNPVDAIVILILQRCWGDGWQLKPADLLDLRQLIRAAHVRRTDLLARAHELRCLRTVQIFLERCDPWEARLDLSTPAPHQVRVWQRAVARERPLLRWERSLGRLPCAPGLIVDVARGLPAILRAFLLLRREPSIPRLLDRMTPAARARHCGTVEQRMRTARGVIWALRLVRLRSHGSCLLRSLALFHALRRQGWPVVFVSGVRRAEDGLLGHAWLELDGQVLPELREPGNRRQFTVSLQYP